MYDDATIDEKAYRHFAGQLESYLSVELTLPVFANFLRSYHDYQKSFQVCRDCHGQARFLKAEALFHYEHSSNFRIADATHEKLLAEVSDEDFVPYELPGRLRCDQLEQFLSHKQADPRTPEGRAALKEFVEPVIADAQQFVQQLAEFVHTQAKLPGFEKNYLDTDPIEISADQGREEIIEYLQQMRSRSATADLAFYAYRDMQSCDWRPFAKAAVERNPVSIEGAKGMSAQQIVRWLDEMANVSIYDGKRLAQPDEVVNYKTGDGLEKAFVLANIIGHSKAEQNIDIIADGSDVILKAEQQYRFVSDKGFAKEVKVSPGGEFHSDCPTDSAREQKA
jgi:hypothetical protein